MKETVLLIDADGFIFSTAIVLQETNPFDDTAMPTFDRTKGIKVLEARFKKLIKKFNADRVIMFVSCRREEGHRRTMITESYKANRNNQKSPVGLPILRSYVEKHYETISEPALEADDLIGIYSSDPKRNKEFKQIIVSMDKDVIWLAGRAYSPNKDKKSMLTKAESLKKFIFQTICGDSADGYKGIPGIGKVGANKFINGVAVLSNIWEELVELAATKKCDEEYMMVQARLAWILRHGDYNFDTQEIKLWTPDRIQDML